MSGVAQLARLVSAPDAPDYGWIEFSEPRYGSAPWRGSRVERFNPLEIATGKRSPRRHGNPDRDFACVFTLSSNGEESGIELDQIDPYAADMLGFFEEMARDAAGWNEPKGWFSEFIEVQIIATHRRSDVELRVLMRWEERPGQPHRTKRDEDPWYEQERQGVLTVQPEDLGPFAAQMRRLMRRELGAAVGRNGGAGARLARKRGVEPAAARARSSRVASRAARDKPMWRWN